MTEREITLIAVGLVAGYIIGRAHAKRMAGCKCAGAAQVIEPADPLAWLSDWQRGTP